MGVAALTFYGKLGSSFEKHILFFIYHIYIKPRVEEKRAYTEDDNEGKLQPQHYPVNRTVRD